MIFHRIPDMEMYWKLKVIETILTFAIERCCVTIEAEVKTKDLYENYVKWCENTGNNLFLVGKNKFITILYTSINANGEFVWSFRTNKFRGWRGICLIAA